MEIVNIVWQNLRTRSEAILTVITAVAAFSFGSQVLDIWQNSPFTDLAIMYNGARAVSGGQSPYDIEGLRQTPFGALYKYPPWFAVLLAPFSRFPIDQLAHIWVVTSLGLYLGTFFLVVRTTSLGFRTTPFYLLAIAFLFFQPSLDTLFGGQLEFLLLFLFTIAYWAMQQLPPRHFFLGVSIGLAAIKAYPILLVTDLMLRRAWKSLVWLALTLGLLTVVSIALGGWQLQEQFYLKVLPILSGGTASPENQSYFGFFARLFVNGAAVDPARFVSLPLAAWLSNVAALLTFLISMAMLIRAREPTFAFVILIPLMLLITPAAWIHYEAILLLPLSILLSDRWKHPTMVRWIPLLVAFALLAFGNEDNVRSVTVGLIQSYKFYGVFLVWLMGIVWAWRDQRSGRTDTNPD
jgi:hypothetical protein